VREYRRAAHLLASCSSHRAVFLRGYSLYLAGEKRKEDLHIESPGSSGGCKSSAAGDANSELKTLYRQFSDAHKAGSLDGLGLYLYGMVLKALQLQPEARSLLQVPPPPQTYPPPLPSIPAFSSVSLASLLPWTPH
jgi:anaphase-promoting complex subunit 8